MAWKASRATLRPPLGHSCACRLSRAISSKAGRNALQRVRVVSIYLSLHLHPFLFTAGLSGPHSGMQSNTGRSNRGGLSRRARVQR
eukprot:6179223-Pleurochrysis_carterae.AAC.6